MTYEVQLKALKKGIVLQHLTQSGSSERNIRNVLKDEIQQYELVSTRYNELFENILKDTNKMVEEYYESVI